MLMNATVRKIIVFSFHLTKDGLDVTNELFNVLFLTGDFQIVDVFAEQQREVGATGPSGIATGSPRRAGSTATSRDVLDLQLRVPRRGLSVALG